MTERQDQGTQEILAKDVQPGDMLDLYGDAYADPDRDPMHGLEFEFAAVEGLGWEGTGTVVIYTGSRNFACPPDHVLYRNVE